MTYDELLLRAQALATQKIVVENYAIMNVPSDMEQRIRLDAQSMIARDELAILDSEYRSAIKQAELDGVFIKKAAKAAS